MEEVKVMYAVSFSFFKTNENSITFKIKGCFKYFLGLVLNANNDTCT